MFFSIVFLGLGIEDNFSAHITLINSNDARGEQQTEKIFRFWGVCWYANTEAT